MYENQCSTPRIISDPQVHNVWLDPDPTLNLENVKKKTFISIFTVLGFCWEVDTVN